MECSAVYLTPKIKFNRNTTSSPSDASPVEKRAKELNSPDVTSSGGKDEVMVALNLSEGVAEKFYLLIAKLCSLDSKMEDLNTTGIKVYPLWKLTLTPLKWYYDKNLSI